MTLARLTATRNGRLLLAAVVLGLGAIVVMIARGPNVERPPAASGAPAAAAITARIPVDGMTCPVCAASVKKALLSVPGVERAEISLERREAVVRYDERQVRADQLVATVDRTGYQPGAPVIERSRR